MEIMQSKKLFLIICEIGCLIIFLGILFSARFVANHLSRDGILEGETIVRIKALQLVCISLAAYNNHRL